MVNAVGTLSTRGWAVVPEHKIAEAFKHFSEAGYSQTTIYRGSIKSLSYIRKQYAGMPEDMASAVVTSLTELLENIFGTGNARVTCDPIYEDDGPVFTLAISAQVVENGVTYDAADQIKINEG